MTNHKTSIGYRIEQNAFKQLPIKFKTFASMYETVFVKKLYNII